MIPAVDHSGLSPSGRVSKRARKAWMDVQAARLFPPGYWDEPIQTPAEANAAKALRLRRSAATLREMADRGMSQARFRKQADALDAQADVLEGGRQ